MRQGEEKVAVVTGSSTGIGFESSLMLARNGFFTYATMRKIDGGGSKQIIDIAKKENLPLQAIQLDVNNDNSVRDAINRIAKEKDRIDVVVNNAGYALIGAFEENSMEEVKTQFETNFFWCNKSNAGNNSYNEKPKKRQNSKYNVCGREN